MRLTDLDITVIKNEMHIQKVYKLKNVNEIIINKVHL